MFTGAPGTGAVCTPKAKCGGGGGGRFTGVPTAETNGPITG